MSIYGQPAELEGERMNRQQRRANGMKSPVRTYTLTGDQGEKIKNDAAREAGVRIP